MRLLNSYRAISGTLGARPYLPSLIAFLVIVSFAVYSEKQNRTIAQQEQHALAFSETSRLRAQVEGYVNADIQLLRGMVAAFSTNLDMSQEQYTVFTEQLLGEYGEFINIAAAPDLVVSRVYPYEANRSVLGLDYNQNEAQRAAALRVRDDDAMVLAGPVNLVQGGTGFIGRFPVWETNNGTRRFWGIVSAVIDAQKLYEQAGLLDETLSLDVALVGKDGSGSEGEFFFGSPEILDDNPILATIQLPNGTWQMATRPKGGWQTNVRKVWATRAFFALSSLVILLPLLFVARLSNSRRKIISQLRRREEELERLSLVAKHASDSVVLSDADGKIIWVNAGFTRMTGYTPEEAVGKTISHLLNAEETDPYTIEKIKHHQKRGQRFQTEILNKTKSGHLIWVDTNMFPIFDEDGKVSLRISIEREITQAKRYEIELAEAKSAAEKADRAKSEFLANMSHEIRTPMNAIIGLSELLLESPLAEEERQNIGTIRDSGHALLKIINDILDLSRLESGKLEIAEVDFELRQCVDNVVDLLKFKADQKNIALTVEYAENAPATIRTDDGRLRQILLNLIGNAIKFTSEGGVRVLISGDAKAPDIVKIEVFDTGIGITPEQAKHVFDRFSQADAATTRAFGGTGLGLTISTMLARRMGGDITLCDAYKDGACFIATIKAKPAQGAESSDVPLPLFDAERLKGARILLAEDNKTNRLLIRKYLAEYSVDLIEVEDGLKAVEQCRRNAPEVVLMDMSMPELDGVSATRIIRSLSINQPPIIALTANAFDSDKQACLDAGMDFFLSKPINKAHLLQALSTHLEHRLAS